MRYTALFLAIMCSLNVFSQDENTSWITPWLTWKTAIGCVCGAYLINKATRFAVLPAHRSPVNPYDPKEYSIRTNDGIDLDCVILDKNNSKVDPKDLEEQWQRNSQSRVVIVYAGNGVSGKCIDYAYALSQLKTYANCYKVIFNYPGVGRSGGSFTTFNSLCRNSRAIHDHMITHFGFTGNNITHYGHSIGGVVATRVVADIHNSSNVSDDHKPHVRCDRSIMRLDGFIPDTFIDRRAHPWINSCARGLAYGLLQVQGLYPHTYNDWHRIPDGYKDFRQSAHDGIIPETASFAHELYERDNINTNYKIVPDGSHNDLNFIQDLWSQ